MENLAIILQFMFQDADPMLAWIVATPTDTGIPYILEWNLPDPQPDDATILANESAALEWQAMNALKAQARDALSSSDIAILRLIEQNSTLVPTEWATYRQALRTIISETTMPDGQVLPTRPANPPADV